MERRRRITGLKGSWDWLEFAAQLPSSPQFLSSQAASVLVYSGRCILTGGYVQNNGTAAGGINLLDGQDATGGLVVVQPLSAQQALPITLPAQGVLCEIGVYAQITTAVIKGAVFVIPLWHDEYTAPGD